MIPKIKVSTFLSGSCQCPLPRHYVIDTGNICNLHCPFCHTGIREPGISRGMLSREHFDLIFEKIKPYAKQIDLYNWGEPFLNKEILYMTKVCSENNIFSHIDSTLTSFDFSEDYAEEIVKSGISSIFASIDGATQRVYEKYRVGGNIDRALNNLQQLIKAKERLRMKTPGLGWVYYIHNFNEHEIDKAKKIAKSMGVNIWFKLLSCNIPWQSSFHKRWSKTLETPRWVWKNYPVPRNPRLTKILKILSWATACRQPFISMVIGWNGAVTPCTAVSGEQYALGNLLNDSLENIWNGIKLRNCREFLINYGPKQDMGSICETVPCPLTEKHR